MSKRIISERLSHHRMMTNDLQRAFLSVNCLCLHDKTSPRRDSAALKTDFAAQTLVSLAVKIHHRSSNICSRFHGLHRCTQHRGNHALF